MSIKYIRQYDEKDCGPACLAMISQFYGKRVSIPRLRDVNSMPIFFPAWIRPYKLVPNLSVLAYSRKRGIDNWIIFIVRKELMLCQ
jgi:hypothetical protein